MYTKVRGTATKEESRSCMMFELGKDYSGGSMDMFAFLNVELLHPLHFTLHAVARPYEGGKLKCRERKYTLSGSTGRRNEKKCFYSSKE